MIKVRDLMTEDVITVGPHTTAEIMTQRVRAIAPDRTAREAARLMREAEVHRVLVMEGDRLAGILSASDIVTAVADELV